MSATIDGRTVAVTKKPNAGAIVQSTAASAGLAWARWSNAPHATAGTPPTSAMRGLLGPEPSKRPPARPSERAASAVERRSPASLGDAGGDVGLRALVEPRVDHRRH